MGGSDHEQQLRQHYHHGTLLRAIDDAFRAAGQDPLSLHWQDLSALEEFHLGGRRATQHLCDQLALQAGQRVLDFGCGIGGTARFLFRHYGCDVIGIDLSGEYIRTGQILNQRLGVAEHIELLQGGSVDVVSAQAVDAALILHVGMNLPDKTLVFRQLANLLSSGACLGIYDVVRCGDGALTYPLPWATDAQHCFVDTETHYMRALRDAGFYVRQCQDRSAAALRALARSSASTPSSTASKPALSVLLGDGADIKFANLFRAVQRGDLAPIEIIAVRD